MFGIDLLLLIALALYITYQMIFGKRGPTVEAIAHKHGLKYSEAISQLPPAFRAIDMLKKGRKHRYNHVVEGHYQGYRILAFQFVYETVDLELETTTHWYSIAVVHLPVSCPEVKIHPEHVGHRLANLLGFQDINFESMDFSNAFRVLSKNKRFAYDVCNPRMMEYLLKKPKTTLEIENEVLAIWEEGHLSGDSLIPLLDHAVALRKNIPDVVFSHPELPTT